MINREGERPPLYPYFVKHEQARVFGGFNFLPTIPTAAANVLTQIERYEDRGRMRNVTREAGERLNMLVNCHGSQHILELGTSNGYSTIWLASAAREIGGRVLTVEKEPWKARLARKNLAQADFSSADVRVITQQALQVAQDIEGPLDFVFMDLLPQEYMGYINALLSKMKSNSLLVADNMASHRERDGTVVPRGIEGEDYMNFVFSTPFSSTYLPEVGSGFLITRINQF